MSINVVVIDMFMVVLSLLDIFINGYKLRNLINIKLLISIVLINSSKNLVMNNVIFLRNFDG